MFRIDPLTDTGTIDVDFFTSEEYTFYRKKLEIYLEAEGFDSLKGGFTIAMFDRFWYVKPSDA